MEIPTLKLEDHKVKITKNEWANISMFKKKVLAQSFFPKDDLSVAFLWIGMGHLPSIEQMALFMGHRWWCKIRTAPLSKLCDKAWKKTMEILNKMEEKYNEELCEQKKKEDN